jgi:hypothetical protein
LSNFSNRLLLKAERIMQHSTHRRRLPLLSTLVAGLLSMTLQIITVVPDVHAAPAGGGGGLGMGMGGGPVCPPACPPSPTNCDASLVMTATQALQFGAIAAPAAGTVTVDTAGIRTSTGGVVLITGSTATAAQISMSTAPYTCDGRALVVVSVTSPATLTHTTLGATMTVDNFVTNPAAGGAFDSTIPMTIGATLNVGASQAPGSYTGSFLVTVTFQ